MKAKQRNDEKFEIRVREKEFKMKVEEENRQKYMNDRVQRQAIKLFLKYWKAKLIFVYLI